MFSNNEPFSSLENCDLSRGRIYHTDECTCNIADLEEWYNETVFDREEIQAEMQTENFSDEL